MLKHPISSFRYNVTLFSSLEKYVSSEQDDWDEYIDPCMMAYKPSVSRSTKETPFFLAFGKEPSLHIETAFPFDQQTQEMDE